MKLIKLSFLLCVIVTPPVVAQETAEDAEALRESRIEIEDQMREAEEQLAEAARKIAELSERNLPMIDPEVEVLFERSSKPRLGVTLSSIDSDGPVDGVTLTGITPGSAAADAGLRAGDIITAINAQSLNADTNRSANEKLVDFMSGVEQGDKLDIEYLRDGNVGKLTLTPRIADMRAFVFPGGEREKIEIFSRQSPGVAIAPHVQRRLGLGSSMFWFGNSLSDMELVELSEGLGRYFAAKSGLLVVSVPEENEFQLQDGDVIQSVDDREPESVGHLMRILASYAPGESLEIRIMRDKKRQTIKLTMPAERVGSVAPVPPVPPLPKSAIRPPMPAMPVRPAAAPRLPYVVDRTRSEIRT